ncbi:Fumitremorgin C synthase [Grifola frondosa]|uniref:Fumitremorgin C synthase n=1 Tax=Grifola frondosa TaxID=5627 RepID=A0A1C7LPT1_GRIFR|nr:Fumitremorgin C synthase [Grifola frondosa]
MYSFVVIVISLVLVAVWADRQLKARRLPPGPRAEPIPRDPRGPWLAFEGLRQRYGSIFSFFMGTRPVIVISKAQTAWDLLEKRGEIYSSRPRMIMAHEILSGGMRGLSMPYGKSWRSWRKIHNTGMSGRASLAYRTHQTLESTLVLRGLLESPERYSYHLQLFATSVVLSITYGRRAVSLDDELVKQNYDTILEFQNTPGKYLVEARPLQWFRREAERIRARDTILYTTLLRQVKQKMDAGAVKECISSRSLATMDALGFSEVELAYAVSAPFGAGIDTTVGSVEVFLLAALHFPAAAKKAQEELDRVVGRDRLPTFDDEPALPYLRAYIKEVTRWRPIVPLAVPHAVTRDDTYEGYFIPKGTTVYGNIFAMTQDPEMFPEPAVFRPERFLDTADPRFVEFTLPFGFGRRHCPGMHVALQSIYVVIARILWAFDLEPERDEKGKTVLPDPDDFKFMGLTRSPAPMRFALRPRGPDVARIIEAEAAEADIRLKEWD